MEENKEVEKEEESNVDYYTPQNNGNDGGGSNGGIMPSGYGYDNEWVRFLNIISSDESLVHIAGYLRQISLTNRAKTKLTVYIQTLLDREFTVSRIRDSGDYMRVLDDKNLIDADLPLGLTRFDITPEFQHVINLIRIKFGIKIRRSLGGFERKVMATQRQETVTEERTQMPTEQERSVSNRVRDIFRR